MGRLFDDEAGPLAAAITATGHAGYPVAQRDRDALFLRFAAAAHMPSSLLKSGSGSRGGTGTESSDRR